MAAIRQHILPKFLLKGFASRIKGDERFTWVYQKDKRPFETNIINVAVARYFYGKEGELSVDADITDFEGEYAPFLDELREHHEQDEISDPRIANLITHLVTRTKHIRDSFRESTEYLADKISENFSISDNIKKAILNKTDLMRDFIEQKLKDFPAPQADKETLRQLIPLLMPAFLDSQKTEIRKLLRQHTEDIKRIAKTSIREGHIKGLSQGLIPELRVKTYQKLRWFLFYSEVPIILGDIGCLFEFIEGKIYRSIDSEGHKIKNVFLPISDKKLLIGTFLPEIKDIDINLLNNEIAKCSREFFISSRRSDDILSIVPLIGSDSDIISKDELEQIAKEVVSEFTKPSKVRKGGNGDNA